MSREEQVLRWIRVKRARCKRPLHRLVPALRIDRRARGVGAKPKLETKIQNPKQWGGIVEIEDHVIETVV